MLRRLRHNRPTLAPMSQPDRSMRAQRLTHLINTPDPADIPERHYGYQTTTGTRTFINRDAALLDVAPNHHR